jgi:hypothetical protein
MPIKSDREYRSLVSFQAQENEPYTVRGYASTFEPYVLLSFDGVDYSERIDSRAFDNADMSDVIMQYNHEGRVFARQSNGTLELSIDAHGLAVKADLSSTAGSRDLFEEIRTGLTTKMSFAFTVDSDHYEAETHTRVIDRIAKVYDVSAVSIPANPGTDISARSYFDGVIEAERAERLEREAREQKKAEIRALLKEEI